MSEMVIVISGLGVKECRALQSHILGVLEANDWEGVEFHYGEKGAEINRIQPQMNDTGRY